MSACGKLKFCLLELSGIVFLNIFNLRSAESLDTRANCTVFSLIIICNQKVRAILPGETGVYSSTLTETLSKQSFSVFMMLHFFSCKTLTFCSFLLILSVSLQNLGDRYVSAWIHRLYTCISINQSWCILPNTILYWAIQLSLFYKIVFLNFNLCRKISLSVFDNLLIKMVL